MQIDVGEGRSRSVARKKTPPTGWHVAKLTKVVDVAEGIETHWRIRAEGRQWTVKHTFDPDAIHDFLVDIGLAGRSVDTSKLAGTTANVHYQSRGNRRSGALDEFTSF